MQRKWELSHAMYSAIYTKIPIVLNFNFEFPIANKYKILDIQGMIGKITDVSTHWNRRLHRLTNRNRSEILNINENRK